MSVRTRTLFLGLSALAACLPLSAQTTAAVAQASPAYQSAFEGYRPFEAGDVQDWRKSNDTVREVGGWRAYAREMQGPAEPAAAGASAPQGGAPAQPVAADPHAGHGK